MFVQSIESVFNLVGAISCSAISTLLPLYYYIKLIQKKKKKKRKMYYVSIVMFSIMVPFSVFSVVALYV
jgi:amino acid permease